MCFFGVFYFSGKGITHLKKLYIENLNLKTKRILKNIDKIYFLSNIFIKAIIAELKIKET